MRIFHMVNSLDMGGSEHQMVEVASRQQAKGYEVVVACLSAQGVLTEVLEHSGIPIIEFNPKGSLLRPRGVFQLLRLIWFFVRHPLDVVQTHDLYSTLLGVPAAWLARVPMILSCRRDLSRWWWYTPRRRRFLRYIQNHSTFVIANSQSVRDFLVEQDGFDPNLIRVIPNGVDLKRFTTARPDRRRLFPHLAERTYLVAVVANMNVETKGHPDLIRAAAEVLQECRDAKFLLIGDGPERTRLEAMVTELGLSETVLFLGFCNDVPDILACCDLFVLPSWAEGLPNSVLEAMAAGVPVVATRVGGIPEIIDDGKSGLLVAPKDPQALARAILRLLGDKELAKRFATCARERVQEEFSFERLLSQLDRLYIEGRARKK
jgi:glycosyltransferase involved in cell wall biosynthesis